MHTSARKHRQRMSAYVRMQIGQGGADTDADASHAQECEMPTDIIREHAETLSRVPKHAAKAGAKIALSGSGVATA